MFEEYKKKVIQDYRKKKEEGKLPPNLERHTAARLRNECLQVFHHRYNDQDSEIFKALCQEEKTNAQEYFQKIKISGTNKFKALDNYLKGVSEDTSENNIELLAWLIDFEARPYKPGDIYKWAQSELLSSNTINLPFSKQNDSSKDSSDSEKSPETGESFTQETSGTIDTNVASTDGSAEIIILPPAESKSINGQFGIPPKFHKTLIAFGAVMVILFISYLIYDLRHQCMYWNGDSYQSISCDEKVEGVNIIAKDNSRLKSFKRITRRSEITAKDIGKIYYSKLNNVVTFYTMGGENPEDNDKRLLPMSEHIYKKYVLKINPAD